MGAIPAAGSVSRRREPLELDAWPVTGVAVEADRAAAGAGLAEARLAEAGVWLAAADAVLGWAAVPQAAPLTARPAAARMLRIVRCNTPLRAARESARTGPILAGLAAEGVTSRGAAASTV